MSLSRSGTYHSVPLKIPDLKHHVARDHRDGRHERGLSQANRRERRKQDFHAEAIVDGPDDSWQEGRRAVDGGVQQPGQAKPGFLEGEWVPWPNGSTRFWRDPLT